METQRRPSAIDRLLRLASDVRPGEGATVLMMTANVFIIMLAYYVLKTAREPLILNSGGDGDFFSGPQGKAYASAAQALVLIPATRLYARLTERWPVMTLIRRVLLFFAGCLVAFYVAAQLAVPYLGFAFYVWLGIFNVAAVAQFWAFANDIYAKDVGERVFPVVMIGMALGGFAGGKVAQAFFGLGLGAFEMMLVAAVLLVVHLGLYAAVVARPDVHPGTDDASDADGRDDASPPETDSGAGAFELIFRNGYLMRIALLLILANCVNSAGEYMLAVLVTASAAGASDPDAITGAFYGDYYGTVSLAVLLIQTFLVSRLVKYGGIRAAVLALPIVAFGAYGLIAAGASLGVTRWAKTAENATDYSVMGTAKAMLWLPTTREEKYKAKLAIDTLFVRVGDLLAAGLVLLGTRVLSFGLTTFALVNLGLIVVWIAVGESLARSYTKMAPHTEAATPD